MTGLLMLTIFAVLFYVEGGEKEKATSDLERVLELGLDLIEIQITEELLEELRLRNYQK